MKLRTTLLLAALAYAPCADAAPLLQGETELHIEARGSVLADYAIYNDILTLNDRGKPACEAKRATAIESIKAGLAELGLPANVATFSIGPCEQAKAATGLPSDLPLVRLPIPAPPIDHNGQGGANPADHKPAPLPFFTSKVAVTVRIDDLSKLPKFRTMPGMWMLVGATTIDYHYNKPGEVHAAAYADALVKARKEADLLAHALGAHVVRLTRVSNRESPLSIGDAISALGSMGPNHGNNDQSWMIPASQSVSVAIDYVISPD